jgi:rod shape determining protein RodA
MLMLKTIAWRKLRFRFDWTLTLAMLGVISLGLINLWSAVRERQFQLFAQQISWLAIGGMLFLIVASWDYRRIARLGYVFYACGVLLLIPVLALGKVAGGARRWFDFGPLHGQPSELMKVVMIVALAKYVNDEPALEGRSVRHLLLPAILVGLPVLLIAAQPDLGTALIIALIFISVMLTARLKLRTLGGILAVGALAIAPIWEYLLRDYQRNRVLAFINPALDPATAWQPQQAMRAVGSGRFIGKGFLHGTQIRLRSLPALWTDFPFAVWAEEWGFLGCMAVLVAYGVLILWVLKIAREARDRFGITVCVGCAAMLFWQVTVNIGMVTGLLPVVGVTLPLISYGGSSVVAVMMSLGLVMNVSVRRFAY